MSKVTQAVSGMLLSFGRARLVVDGVVRRCERISVTVMLTYDYLLEVLSDDSRTKVEILVACSWARGLAGRHCSDSLVDHPQFLLDGYLP